MNIACGIEYDGTGYHGFQRQPDAHGLTVQGVLEAAISQISGEMSVIHGAGRTDAGVHASGQVVHFHTHSHLTPEVWQRALNAVLPNAVAVRWTKEVPDRFHARVRTLSEARCTRQVENASCIYYDFTADGFLTGMVRRMVGTVLLVGQGHLCLNEFEHIVQRAQKMHPGAAAPAHGLCLVRVEYPEEFGVTYA